MSIAEEFLVQYNGDKKAAAVGMGVELMRSDPETFKQGYTPANAAIAVKETFDLTASEYRDVQRSLTSIKNLQQAD